MARLHVLTPPAPASTGGEACGARFPSEADIGDEAKQLLQLAARLHAARGDPAAWRGALADCREWLNCSGVLLLPDDGASLGPDELEALAGRLTHCAGYGGCACGRGDATNRARCAALAPHLHEAAITMRTALRAAVFDHLPPTWIIDRSARLRDANAAARAAVRADDRVGITDGLLTPVARAETPRLRRAVAELGKETRFSWPVPSGEATLLLRPLPDGVHIAATLLPDPLGISEVTAIVAAQFGLTARQSELAAQLLAGQTLADAAREMGVSRHTANEHLVALMRRLGAADRKALVCRLRGAVQC